MPTRRVSEWGLNQLCEFSRGSAEPHGYTGLTIRRQRISSSKTVNLNATTGNTAVSNHFDTAEFTSASEVCFGICEFLTHVRLSYKHDYRQQAVVVHNYFAKSYKWPKLLETKFSPTTCRGHFFIRL